MQNRQVTTDTNKLVYYLTYVLYKFYGNNECLEYFHEYVIHKYSLILVVHHSDRLGPHGDVTHTV